MFHKGFNFISVLFEGHWDGRKWVYDTIINYRLTRTREMCPSFTQDLGRAQFRVSGSYPLTAQNIRWLVNDFRDLSPCYSLREATQEYVA